jgi:hypothetical protein
MTAILSALLLDERANLAYISARLADMAKLPKNETMRPHTTAVGPPEGRAIESEVAIAVHEFRIA